MLNVHMESTMNFCVDTLNSGYSVAVLVAEARWGIGWGSGVGTGDIGDTGSAVERAIGRPQ
jgi:hypothetical protein